MRTFLTTDRLRLREFTSDDADVARLVALNSDPEVMRYINGGKPTDEAAVRAHTLPRLTHHFPCLSGPASWAAHERTTEEFLGWFGLRPTSEHSADELELGYRLRRAAWGHGYATEGARALVHHAFHTLGARRVTANTMTVNAASRRVLTNAGLHYHHTFFADWPDVIPGAEHGDVEYDLTRDRWERTEKPA